MALSDLFEPPDLKSDREITGRRRAVRFCHRNLRFQVWRIDLRILRQSAAKGQGPPTGLPYRHES
jgi:hypothetical protein